MVNDVFRLPEVVAAILNAGSEENRLLYSCLFVNRLFREEATRLLWSKCDSSPGAHPDIEDLGAMVLRDDIGPERAQTYANLVRELSFHYDNTFIDQTSWHAVLCQLQFPQLTSVSFWETTHGPTLNTEDVILHYAQSNLRHLSVDVCGPLSDVFFQRMAELGSRLESLLLHPSCVPASASSVVRMLERLPNIDALDLERGFDSIFSPDMLRSIACCPSLDQAVLPYVPDGCLLAVQTVANVQQFSKLRYLYVGATADSLNLYHCVAPRITALGLANENLGRTDHVLTPASMFRYLTSFTAELSASTTFRGDELVQLAQGCPGLEEIRIGMDSYSSVKPRGAGISDELIESLAPHLASVKVLSLLFECVNERGPGCIRTICTLGRYCKSLQELVLSCESDWSLIKSLANDVEGPLAASLEQLQILPDTHMMLNMTEEEHRSLLEIWQLNAKAWLPQLSLMIMPEADDWEDEFVNVLMDGVSSIDEEEEAMRNEKPVSDTDGPDNAGLVAGLGYRSHRAKDFARDT